MICRIVAVGGATFVGCSTDLSRVCEIFFGGGVESEDKNKPPCRKNYGCIYIRYSSVAMNNGFSIIHFFVSFFI